MTEDKSERDAQAESPADESPDIETPAESGDAGETPKKKRRRRGRRGGAKRRKSGTDEKVKDEAQADTETDSASEDDTAPDADADESSQQADTDAANAPAAEKSDWDELFEDRTFNDLGLRNSVVKGVEALGFKHPTRIQAMLIPPVIEGKDVLGQARTGSGKTAAFGLPLFHCAQRAIPFQSIILAPTRELAIQIASEMETFGKFTPIKVCAVYGGQRISAQVKRLEKGPEIIVATPGRLMDLQQRRLLHFDNVRFAVLDEVDRMLDIGFRDEIRKILSRMKSDHQTVFVSATISDDIEALARRFMKDPEKLVATTGSLTVNLVDQYYITAEKWDKKRLLVHVLTHEEPDLTVVFCRMKRTVDELTKYLNQKNIEAHAIHGDMYQGQRNNVMRKLRSGQLSVLVASDLAARGLDIENISHVVNYDLPEDPEVYIHRIGRTARAGRGGVAWSLVTPEEGKLLTQIEKLANIHIPAKTYDDFEPGRVPSSVAQERTREEARLEQLKSGNRYSGPELPEEKTEVSDSRFPGGKVPTKMPPKRIGGRVRTTRKP